MTEAWRPRSTSWTAKARRASVRTRTGTAPPALSAAARSATKSGASAKNEATSSGEGDDWKRR